MKKIFIAIPTLRSGGAERFATELACNINRDKFECSVIVTRKLDKTSAFYDKLINNGIRVIDISDSNYIKEVVNAVKLLRKEKPSIIHTNVGAALHMLAPIIISGTKSTHLFTAHSMGYRIFAGAKKRIVNVCFKKRWIIPVGICDTVKQSLVEAYHLKSSDVECVYNGVDTEIFYPCEKEKDDSKIVFVSTGTLYHIKNHELLIDAFSIVHKKYSTACTVQRPSIKAIFFVLIICLLLLFIVPRYILPMIPQETLARLSIDALQQDNGSGRGEIWKSGLNTFMNGNIFNFIFGYGYGKLEVLSPIGLTSTMHNQYIQQLVSYGLIGFLLYICMTILAYKQLKKNYRRYVGAYFGIMLMSMTLTMGPSYKILWILLFQAGLMSKGGNIYEKY